MEGGREGAEFGRTISNVTGLKFKNGLPVTSTGTWNAARVRTKMQKSCKSFPLILLCGFVTLLVLHGAVGFNNISDPPSVPEDETVTDEDDEWNQEHARDLAEMNASSRTLEFTEPESDDPAVQYSLGPEIKNWNEQRAEWLDNNPDKKTPEDGQPRILLVTGSQPKPCENQLGDHLLLKAIKNKMDYGRLHDIDIFYNIASLDEQMAGFWTKLPLIRKLMLAHPEVEWIWWMDSDALITDMLFELPIQRYEDYSMVLHGWEELVYDKQDWVGLNTGSFLLRNNQWSLDLLDIWAPMGPKGRIRIEAGKLLSAKLLGRPEFEADDQSALIYLLGTREDELRPQVFLENEYCLHGYWVNLVEKYEEMMENNRPGLGDDRWPFVTHFVGCKPCGKYSSYEEEKCMNNMERAFNFADNQILNQYGLQHRELSTPKLKRIRNDSSTPLESLGQTFWSPAV